MRKNNLLFKKATESLDRLTSEIELTVIKKTIKAGQI